MLRFLLIALSLRGTLTQNITVMIPLTPVFSDLPIYVLSAYDYNSRPVACDIFLSDHYDVNGEGS